MKTYYSAGGARVAVRTGSSTLSFILTDHPSLRSGQSLGSTGVSTDSSGTLLTDNRYKAWGESRYASGTLPTKFTYTGQYSNVADFGLMYYGARWYDSYLNRWIQPDSIIPLGSQGVQAWDRYAFVNNNPVRYNDPSGHSIPPWPSLFSNINITVSNGWDLVAGAACFVLCGVLPVHYESYGLGEGAIVGDSPGELAQKSVTLLGATVIGGGLSSLSPSDDLPISNPVPNRLARVIPSKYANTAETLGPSGMGDVFVTAADDLAGITSSQELAKRLTLLDNSGNPLQGPLAILEFDTPSVGVASPVFRNNPGFVGGGRTAGGAREFVIPNSRLEDLENLFIRSVK